MKKIIQFSIWFSILYLDSSEFNLSAATPCPLKLQILERMRSKYNEADEVFQKYFPSLSAAAKTDFINLILKTDHSPEEAATIYWRLGSSINFDLAPKVLSLILEHKISLSWNDLIRTYTSSHTLFLSRARLVGAVDGREEAAHQFAHFVIRRNLNPTEAVEFFNTFHNDMGLPDYLAAFKFFEIAWDRFEAKEAEDEKRFRENQLAWPISFAPGF